MIQRWKNDLASKLENAFEALNVPGVGLGWNKKTAAPRNLTFGRDFEVGPHFVVTLSAGITVDNPVDTNVFDCKG